MLSHSFRCVRKLSSFRSPLLRSLQQNHPLPRKTLIPSLSLVSNPLFPPSTFSHFSTSVSDFTITSKCSPIPVVVEEEDESNIGYRNTHAYAAIELALDSVVKIFTVSSSPNYFLPWQNKSQRETIGSGFVITGRRILTNAHVVAGHTFVLVRKHGSPTKYRAEIQAIGHECDLAPHC